jgi:hypothetical protein
MKYSMALLKSGPLAIARIAVKPALENLGRIESESYRRATSQARETDLFRPRRPGDKGENG